MDINLYKINRKNKEEKLTNADSSCKKSVKRCSSVQKTIGDIIDIYQVDKKKPILLRKNSKKEDNKILYLKILYLFQYCK